MLGKLKLFSSKFSLCWLSCMLVMVQGELNSLTVSHAITASKTGLIAGSIIVLMSFLKVEFKYKLALVVFIACTLADLFSHQTHFGMFLSEAIITGFTASLLSYFISLTSLGKRIEKELNQQ